MDVQTVRDEIRMIENRLRELEIELNHVPNAVERHEERLKGLEIFKAQVLALATIGSVIGGVASSLFQRYLTH